MIYRIAGNVCEEIFAVCAFSGIAQTLHPLKINFNTCDFACTFQLAMSLLRYFSRMASLPSSESVPSLTPEALSKANKSREHCYKNR